MGKNLDAAAEMRECDRMMAALKARRGEITLRLQKLSAIRRPLPEETERLAELQRETSELAERIGYYRERKIALGQMADAKYERAYMAAVKELIDMPTQERLRVRALEIMEQRKERVASLGVGSAIPVLGSIATPKERDE